MAARRFRYALCFLPERLVSGADFSAPLRPGSTFHGFGGHWVVTSIGPGSEPATVAYVEPVGRRAGKTKNAGSVVPLHASLSARP